MELLQFALSGCAQAVYCGSGSKCIAMGGCTVNTRVMVAGIFLEGAGDDGVHTRGERYCHTWLIWHLFLPLDTGIYSSSGTILR